MHLAADIWLVEVCKVIDKAFTFLLGVLSLLWFRRQLPAYAAKFIEMVNT